MAINLGSALVYLGGELTGLKDDLEQGRQETTSWAKNLGDTTLKFVSGAVVGGVTAAAGAVAAIGGVALSTASDIDAATKKSISQLGTLAGDTEKIGQAITNVYANNFGDSIEDVGQAVTDVTQLMDRFGEMTAEELQKSTEHAIALRDAFGIEVTESAAAAGTLMERFGLTSEEAFTFVQSGLQNGLNASGDFLDSINEYSVQFADGGASASEFFSVMLTGLQNGMLGTDKAADLFKEFRLRIQDGSATTADALADIGLSVDDIMAGLNDGSLTVMDAFTMVQRGLSQTENKTDAFNAGVALMGSQFEDLGETAVDAIDSMAVNMDDIVAITTDINKQYETWPTFFEGIKRQGQVALVPLGNALLGIGNRALPLINSGFEWLEANVVPIFEKIAEVAQLFFDNLDNGLPVMPAFKTALYKAFGPETYQQINTIINAIQSFWEKIQEALEPVINLAVQFVSFKDVLIVLAGAIVAIVLPPLAALIVSIGAVAVPILAAIAVVALMRNAWENDWGGIQAKVAAVIAFVTNLVNTAMTALRDFWAQNGEAMLTKAQQIWTAIQTAISTVWGLIQTLFSVFRAAFEGDWSAFGENLRRLWDETWELIVGIVGELWGRIRPILTELWGSIQSWWGGISWSSLGSDLVDGIISGLGDLASRLLAKIQEAAQAAQDAWNGFWGNQSPSKWMKRSAGYIMEGGIIGLENNKQRLVDTARRIAAQVAEPFAGSGERDGRLAAGQTVNNQNSQSRSQNFYGDFIFPGVKDKDSMLEELEALAG